MDPTPKDLAGYAAGLTTREYMATAAMAAMLSQPHLKLSFATDQTRAIVADWAALQADALIARLASDGGK